MPEAPISPKLFLERITPVNKIEKQTVVGIGRVISVDKMQIHYLLMPDCSTSQIGLQYVCIVRSWLLISVYLSSLPVAHLSDAPRRRLVQGYRTKLLRAPPGSLTCSMYSNVTRDLIRKTFSNCQVDQPGNRTLNLEFSSRAFNPTELCRLIYRS